MISIVNNVDKKVIVAFRGTKPSHFSDLVHDAAIAFNQVIEGSVIAKMFNIPHRFNSALHFTQESVNKFPGYKVTLTGHSLGGTLAEHVSMSTGI